MPILQILCEYKKVGACSIQADVYLPSAEHPPVILYIHGGALISGSRKHLSDYKINLYKRAGFALVSIDYRLAPETKIASIMEDIRDALGWVRGEGARLFHFDTDRIAVAGGSAGGYLSLMTGTFAPKPRAIVSFYGYGDILGDWYCQPSAHYLQQSLISKEEAYASVGRREITRGTRGRYTFYFYCRQQGIWPEAVSGYCLATERDKLLPYCPVHNIGADYPPTLLLHGDQDTDVPCEQSVQMSKALERQGIANELIILPGGGHGFDAHVKNPEVKRAVDATVTFLKRHLA